MEVALLILWLFSSVGLPSLGTRASPPDPIPSAHLRLHLKCQRNPQSLDAPGLDAGPVREGTSVTNSRRNTVGTGLISSQAEEVR